MTTTSLLLMNPAKFRSLLVDAQSLKDTTGEARLQLWFEIAGHVMLQWDGRSLAELSSRATPGQFALFVLADLYRSAKRNDLLGFVCIEHVKAGFSFQALQTLGAAEHVDMLTKIRNAFP